MSQLEIRSLDLRAATRLQLGTSIHRGLSAAKVTKFLRTSGWNKSQLFEWAHIPPANGNRRFRAGRFHDHESERIARLARLFDAAWDMLRDGVRASEWLQQPNELLDGHTPIKVAGTELGGREVEALIGRLRHGVY